MYKIVGVQYKEGKLDNGTPWQQYVLHTITDDINVIDGCGVEAFKVKPVVIENYMKNKGIEDVKKLINQTINPLYDKYGKIQVL